MKQHFFMKPGAGMKSRNKKKAGPINIQQQRQSGIESNQQKKNAGPSNEHIKRIAKQRMNAVQQLPCGPLMAAVRNIDEPSCDLGLRKK
jgi:hypothetical protein